MLPRPKLLPADTVFHGRYRIVAPIKSGGMGTIYEVVDEKTTSRRALKVMLASLVWSAPARARFELEAKSTGAIESDHLVRILDAGIDTQTDLPFLVMELLRGEDLGALLEREGPLSNSEALLYLRQAAIALDKLHSAAIVHRDIKPDNLFLTRRDDGESCIKILDFGLVKTQGSVAEEHKTRGIVGTPLYMSPEQVAGESNIGGAADIYALGHVAYDMLVGEPYWSVELEATGSPVMLVVDIAEGFREPPCQRAWKRKWVVLPEPFNDWFARATNRNPNERFSKATHAIAALADILRADTLFTPSNITPSNITPSNITPSTFTPSTFTPSTFTPSTFTHATREMTPAESPSKPVSERLLPSAKPLVSVAPIAAVPTTNPPSPRVLGKKGFLIAVDAATNVVRVDVWGFWDINDGQAYWEEFRRKTAPLVGKRWYVLANISNFPPQKPEVSAFVEKTMSHANAHGIVRAANLVSSALGKMQIQRLSAESGLPLFSFFTTEGEALRWLLTGK